MADLKKLLTEYPDQAKTFVDQYGRKVDENGNPIESSSIDPEIPFLSTALSAPMLGSYTEASDKLDRMRSVMDRYNRMKESSMASKSFMDLVKENPELKLKAEQAAAKNPEFKKLLESSNRKLFNPAFTERYVSAVESMSDSPLMKRLKEAKAFLGKGVESASEMISPVTSRISKVVEPVASVAGKAADVVNKIPYAGGLAKWTARGAAPGLEAYLAKKDYNKGKYVSAAGHGLSAAGSGLLMVPHPYAKMAGAGLLGIGTGIGLSTDDEPESATSFTDSDIEKAKQVSKSESQYGRILNALEDEYENEGAKPSPSPASDFADEKMPELPEEKAPSPVPSPMPSPTPSPTPAPSIQLSGARKPSSISDKLMDVIGMPSAYAEDTAPIAASSPQPTAEPAPGPTPPAAKKKVKDRAYYKNYATAMATKTGVNPALFLSIFPVESGWNMDTTLENPEPGELGAGNAVGPAQIMPGTAADFVNRAANQKYESPEVQAHVQGLVNNLKSKINFTPYQNAWNEIQELKRKKIKPSAEQEKRLADLTNHLKARLKELKPEEHLALSAGILKLKSLDFNLDALNPDKKTNSYIPGTRSEETHGQRLRRSYTGIPKNPEELKKSYDYLDKTEQYYRQERDLQNEFNREEEKEVIGPDGKPKKIRVRVHSDIALPYGSGLEALVGQSEEDNQVAKASTTKDNIPEGKPSSEERKPVTLDEVDSTPLTSGEKNIIEEDGYPSDIKEILMQSREEDKDRRLRDLMVLRNYLQSGTMAQIGKGLQLMASGVVGAGPKKPFITVPKLEGMETWDTIAKEGEKGVAASELMNKFAQRSPSSLPSRRMQNMYISMLKRRGKPLDAKGIEVIKAMSAEELEKQMELEKTLLKDDSSIFGKTLDRQFKVQKQAQARSSKVLDPIIQKVTGSKTLEDTIAKVESGELTDSKVIARQLSNDLAALLLPVGVKLGVTAQEEAQINTARTKFENFKNFFDSSEIRGVIPKAYLDQMKVELKIFKDRYLDLFKRSAEGLKKEFHGLPEEYHDISDNVIDARTQAILGDAASPPQTQQVSKPFGLTEEQRKRYEELKAKQEGRYEEWKAKQEGR
jgi:hypothetical protein